MPLPETADVDVLSSTVNSSCAPDITSEVQSSSSCGFVTAELTSSVISLNECPLTTLKEEAGEGLDRRNAYAEVATALRKVSSDT